MKSQDIGVLLQLVVSLKNREANDHYWLSSRALATMPNDWRDWIKDDEDNLSHQGVPSSSLNDQWRARYSVRSLALETGISKSQVSLSLNRCMEIGLIRKDRKTGLPRTNTQALYNFIVHGLRYVYPTRPSEITRGIATAFAAPVLDNRLFSAGEWPLVWPDARGNTKGQAIEPLFNSAPHAVRRDPDMYAMLALLDAIRIGQPRESQLAAKLLAGHLGITP
ncbi:hypothetical protein [Phytohalomonas tamaricis]|uniref:hypothetical protein n=1 Tax=Phytohalomonas tamaricis TaxID=2081032 RepID=UPI000D0B31E8|nr:hypothetical protein [Phytohalomonas tamaricis]